MGLESALIAVFKAINMTPSPRGSDIETDFNPGKLYLKRTKDWLKTASPKILRKAGRSCLQKGTLFLSIEKVYVTQLGVNICGKNVFDD